MNVLNRIISLELTKQAVQLLLLPLLLIIGKGQLGVSVKYLEEILVLFEHTKNRDPNYLKHHVEYDFTVNAEPKFLQADILSFFDLSQFNVAKNRGKHLTKYKTRHANTL